MDTQVTPRSAAACLECRLAKYKCNRIAGTDSCVRCTQFGFECVTVSHKRGRRPVSKLSGLSIDSIGPISHSKTSQKRQAVSSPSESPQRSSASDRRRSPPAPGTPLQEASKDFEGAYQPQSDSAAALLMLQSARTSQDRSASSSQRWDAERLSKSLVTDLKRKRHKRAVPFTLSGALDDFYSRDELQTHSSADGSVSEGSIRLRQQPKSLASILEPIGQSTTNPSLAATPDTSDAISDPVQVGTIGGSDARKLFAFFMTHLNIWSCLLDPALHTYHYVRARSGFLFSVMLFLGAKLHSPHANQGWDFLTGVPAVECNRKWKVVRDRLHAHARDHAARTLIDGDRSAEAVQSFFFLATWKEINDGLTHIQSGFIFRLALDLRLGDSCPPSFLIDKDAKVKDSAVKSRNDAVELHFRKRQRTFLQLFVQDCIQSVHYVSSHSIPASANVVQMADVWRQHPLAASGDAFCCAAVEVRKIQSRYQEITDGIRTYGRPERIAVSLERDLDEWFSKTSLTVFGLRDPADSSTTNWDGRMRCQYQSLAVWKHTIQLHLSSNILKSMLPAYSNTTQTSTRGSSSPVPQQQSLPADHPVATTCIDAARGVLLAVAAIPGSRVRCMPDMFLLEIAHAARFLTSMICVCEPSSLGGHFLADIMSLIQVVQKSLSQAIYDSRDTIALCCRVLEGLLAAAEKLPDDSRLKFYHHTPASDQQVLSGDGNGDPVHRRVQIQPPSHHNDGPTDQRWLVQQPDITDEQSWDSIMASLNSEMPSEFGNVDVQDFLNLISEDLFSAPR